MGDAPDLTLAILREIRDEIRQTNQRLDQTNQRLDQTREELSARLDQVNVRLESHERLLVRLADDSAVHTQALKQLIARVDGTNDRIDDILRGPMGATVRGHAARLDALEADVAAIKRRSA